MILRAFVQLFLLFLIASAGSAQIVFNTDSSETVSLSGWKIKTGDSSAWSLPTYDDARWQTAAKTRLPLGERGIFWLRVDVLLKGTSHEERPVFRIGLLQSAYEVYWDGVLIGANGNVGTDENAEIPGVIQYATQLPLAGIGNGRHVISLRCSNFHASVPSGWLMTSRIEGKRSSTIFNPMLFLRIALLVGLGLAGVVLGLTLYFAGGGFRSYLYSSLLCFALVFSKSMELLVNLWNAPMTIMRTFDVLYVAGFYVAEIALLVFFLYSFDLPRRRWQVAAAILFSIPFYLGNVHEPSTIPYLNYDIFRVATIPYFYAILFVALKKKKTGSVVASAAYVLYSIPPIMLVSGIVLPSLVYDSCRAALIMVPIIVSGRQVYEQQKREREMEQESRRVRTELLTKTIQPHFLFNSLASVKSLARSNPRKADQLVEALTGEFRLLNEVMAEKEISLAREIELCNHHLKVMGIRRAATYTLVVQDIPANETIPPMVLHTLIENGLTHAFKPKERGYFWLAVERTNGMIRYQLQNNGSQIRKHPMHAIEEGMGLKYVRARLEERYPGQWNLRYGMHGEKWEVIIGIARKEHA